MGTGFYLLRWRARRLRSPRVIPGVGVTAISVAWKALWRIIGLGGDVHFLTTVFGERRMLALAEQWNIKPRADWVATYIISAPSSR